jgi:hypothetical protein
MAKQMALVFWAFCGGLLAAAPLPPAVEKINREGITVVEDVTIQGSLDDKEPEAIHLLKLVKGQLYGLDLGGPELKITIRVEGPDGRLLSMNPGQRMSFKPATDGTYRVRVSSPPGTFGRYLLGVRLVASAAALPPGVHAVGPGGLSIDSALTNSDPVDRVRKQFCKTFDVKMLAGKAYSIDMTSTKIDSYLRLEDTAGRQLAEDDDSGGNLNARILFRPSQDGVYRIISTTFARAIGDFTLKVKEQ